MFLTQQGDTITEKKLLVSFNTFSRNVIEKVHEAWMDGKEVRVPDYKFSKELNIIMFRGDDAESWEYGLNSTLHKSIQSFYRTGTPTIKDLLHTYR